MTKVNDMVDDEQEPIRMAVLGKQLTPNVNIQARLIMVGDRDLEPAHNTLMTIERVILDSLKKNDRFVNVESVSEHTGEPVCNFVRAPKIGNPVYDTPIMVVSVQTVEAVQSSAMVEAPRVFASERLADEMRYVDDGISREEGTYAF